MKKLYSLIIAFLLLFGASTNLLANKDGSILLTVRLSSANEVPAVATKGKGLVTIVLEEDKSMTINGVFDSLSGPVTGCHFHKAIAGVNGGVVLNLLTYVKGNRIYGKIPAATAKPLIADMMADNIYLNVHTAANLGGEIRGQVTLQTDFHFWTIMTGFSEVPPVNTAALGLASVVVSRSLSKVDYKIVVNGLSGPITGAHLHYGSATVAGPVAFPLTFSGSVLTGSFDLPDLKLIDSLDAGRVYVNIHTAANLGGEIRGQLGFINGAIGFDALIEGAQENPPVTTNAKGLMVGWATDALDTMQYAVLYTGLTPNGAHFHSGVVGVNGPVVVALTPYNLAPNAAYVDKIGLSNDNLTKFLKGEMYVNLHSAANAGGEIRGQVSTSILEGLVSDLCSKQENPPTVSNAMGVGYLAIDRNKLYGFFNVVTTGLTSNATAAHIHLGAKGINGSVLVGLGTSTNNSWGGGVLFPRTTLADTAINNGLMYFNVHTAANGGGEIRGQIGKALTPDCLPTAIYELNGEQLEVKTFPNPVLETVTLQFDSNQKMDAQVVLSDLTGRNVLTKNTTVENGVNQLNVNMNTLSQGIYFLQLKNNGKILFAQKVVKQ